MWFVIGLVRSTALYMTLISLMNGQSFFEMLVFYGILLGIHVLIWRAKDNHDPGNVAVNALVHDVIAPFLGIKALIELLLRKYLTDKSEAHAALFASQGIIEAVWSVLLLILVISAIR